MMNFHLPLLALAAALAVPAVAQYAPTPLNDADQLAAEMRVIGANPTDVVALTRAGELSTKLGDVSGAASLFARADKVDPRNGRVKAGMADILLHLERPGEALQFYNQAEGYGYPVARFAAERGLAYDLVAQQGRAQRDYRLALASGAGDDETVRRYALSLGIAGQKEAALQQLEPLLRRNDRAAWRARAFVLAMNGDAGGAQKIAATMMAPGQAGGMAAFFARLPALGPADRAFAVQFGELRPTPQRLADLRLAPALPPLAPETVAVARPAPPVQVATVRPDKRKRPRKGEVQLAAVLPPAAPALPTPPAYGVVTRPVAIAALSPRTLPSVVPRAAVPGSAASARVLPARSPLPPPPILTPRVTPAPMQAPVAVAAAPVQVAPPRSGHYVTYERSDSLIPGRIWVPDPPARLPAPVRLAEGAVTVPAPIAQGAERAGATVSGALQPSPARVTETLSAPTVTPLAGLASGVAVSRALATAPAPVSVARQGGLETEVRVAPAVQPASSPAQPAPVLLAAAPVGSRTQVSAPSSAVSPANAGTGTPASSSRSGAPVAIAASPMPPSPASSVLPRTPATSLTPVRAPGAGIGSASPSAVGSVTPTELVGSGSADPARQSGDAGAVLATALPRAETSPISATPVLATDMAFAAPKTGGEATPGLTANPLALAAPASRDGVVGVGTGSSKPIASDEPAGVAVTRPVPAREQELARIVSALPVPASELDISAPPPILKPAAPVARRQTASLAGDVPHRARSTDLATGTPGSDAPDETRLSATTRHRTATSDGAAITTRKHGVVTAADDSLPAGTRGRKNASGDDAAAPTGKGHRASLARADNEETATARGKHGRKNASSDDDIAPTGKGRRAALAKADADDDTPRHGKHGRHDLDDDQGKSDRKPSGKHAIAAKHESEPQRYWVQVAGGANEASLGKAWSTAQSKAPALAGRKGYTTPLRATNRVLAGPFKTDDEARAFVNTLNKQGVHAFQFTNDKGQKVKRLDDE